MFCVSEKKRTQTDLSCAIGYYEQTIFSVKTCVKVYFLKYLAVYRCCINVMCKKRLSIYIYIYIRAQQTFPIQ